MSLDRQLIDTIKLHFDRRSSVQLQEIVRTNDHARWSPEAIAAADEVLQDRRAGRAEEPTEPEAERPPPPHYDLDGIPLGILSSLTGLLGGNLLNLSVPRLRAVDAVDEENPDQPVPFGPNTAWLALDSTDTEAVAAALGLHGTRAATWEEGIKAARQKTVFVTPPLADWTLAVSTVLFPSDRAEALVKPLLEQLSRQFGDAQYFCTHQDAGLHVWARARRGRLVRGYGWLGAQRRTLWDEGAPTKEERDLGFRFVDEHSVPDEDCVLQLAYLWSIDPTTLDEQFKEPVPGLMGSISGA